ncbi:hypothetical protein C8R45DRAFT_970796 [Mycena sanguinolenta]|nr:hypothetical protein C8R45DRAFT_970796 [Mycena sanguinolenta]
MVGLGYETHKRRNLNLDGKINQRQLGAQGRLTVQETLGFCGYFTPFFEVTISTSRCARSSLPPSSRSRRRPS